jgi:hypothetical protein
MESAFKYFVAAMAALVLLAPVACSINEDRTIARMVASGVDPQKARCALKGASNSATDATLCVVLANKGK